MDDNNNIINPFEISYKGKQAEHHVIDASQYGISIASASRLYTSVIHCCITGEVPRGNYRKDFSCFVEAPKAGSVATILYVAPLLADGNLFAQYHKEALSSVFWMVVESLKKMWLGRDKESVVSELATALTELAKTNGNVSEVLANGLVKANDNQAAVTQSLIKILPELASANRSNARGMVSPVGRSCGFIEASAGGSVLSEISEPEADVIRSKEDLVMGDMESMTCRSIIEINKKTGHCKLEVDRYEGVVHGQIVDPSLETTGNIYTHSFDQDKNFKISAKAATKDGELYRLYIMDAKPE